MNFYTPIIAIVATTLLPLNKVNAQYLIVGTYTNDSPSKGIYVYRFNAATAKATLQSYVEAGNPSYLAISRNGKYIYSVNENDEGKISSFAFNKQAGTLQLLNTQPNNGSAPCYVSIDKTGKWLFAGNYSSGNLTLHPIYKDGSIGSIKQLVQHSGKGTNMQRQEGPHVHCTYISQNNLLLYVPDLGIDKVMVYPFNAKTGFLDTVNASAINIEPGGGPRHIDISSNGKFAYIIEELTGAITVAAIKNNSFKNIQHINNLPDGEAGAAADIHLSPDGKFLYASQRSNNTIQIFKVNNTSGKVAFIGQQTTLGNTPRNFSIHPSGKYLLVGNQNSNEIVILKRNTQTGLLSDSGERIQVGKPVCLKWVY